VNGTRRQGHRRGKPAPVKAPVKVKRARPRQRTLARAARRGRG